MKVLCEICGTDFNAAPSRIAQGRGRFCSIACRNKARWSTHRDQLGSWFWDRVDQDADPDGCWPWLGRKMAAGYGRLVLNGVHHGAHRIAYKLAFGDVPRDRFVCHSCDNPPCCNPKHLWVGTHQDNVDDKMRKGRARGRYSALKARQQKDGG